MTLALDRPASLVPQPTLARAAQAISSNLKASSLLGRRSNSETRMKPEATAPADRAGCFAGQRCATRVPQGMV